MSTGVSKHDPVVERVLLYLSDCVQYHDAELESFRGKLSPARFGLVVWKAKERLRKEKSIEFVPVAKDPIENRGVFIRATEDQKLRRGKAFAKTSLRKTKRALDVLDAVEPSALSLDKQADLSFSKEKIGNAYVRASQEMALTRPPVEVCEVPDVPRRL